eukprot:SAG31_NODE_4977_length_2823_cov_1.691997_1_plen_166_part_00
MCWRRALAGGSVIAAPRARTSTPYSCLHTVHSTHRISIIYRAGRDGYGCTYPRTAVHGRTCYSCIYTSLSSCWVRPYLARYVATLYTDDGHRTYRTLYHARVPVRPCTRLIKGMPTLTYCVWPWPMRTMRHGHGGMGIRDKLKYAYGARAARSAQVAYSYYSQSK